MDYDVASRLTELSQLHAAGKLDDSEFERARRRVINESLGIDGETGAAGAGADPTRPVPTAAPPAGAAAPASPVAGFSYPAAAPTTPVAGVPYSAAANAAPGAQYPAASTAPVAGHRYPRAALTSAAVGLPEPPPPPPTGLPVPPGTPPALPARSRGAARWIAVAGAVVLVVAIGVGAIVLTRGPSGGPSPPPPQGPLDERVRRDAAAVEKLAEKWVPQLLAEPVPTATGPAGGATPEADAVRRRIEALTTKYPAALVLSSGDFSSFERPGFYVVVIGMPYTTSTAALNWCALQKLDRNSCYAKRLSHTVGPAGSAAYQK